MLLLLRQVTASSGFMCAKCRNDHLFVRIGEGGKLVDQLRNHATVREVKKAPPTHIYVTQLLTFFFCNIENTSLLLIPGIHS